MRRYLVVGCGGSGGATLAYMMDQLRSELAAHGVDKIPAGWQFVHLDVPTSPSQEPGVGTVRDQGGMYVGTGPQGDSYKVLDSALSQQLANQQALGTIATWAPRDPDAVHTPLSAGAGQYRALGRMITLSRLREVREALQRAWDTLYLNSTVAEMQSLSVPGAGRFSQNDVPIVLVVSSMAGGAGASMALDICRILTLIPGIDPRLMGVFMVAPDIFDSLPEQRVTGVRANALAMLGEIVASQMGAARDHDVAILRALGHENGEGETKPFARVFPVCRYVGTRTIFGDGTPTAIYRGLGRGLSAMMMSAEATRQFVEYDLTNGGGLPGSREYLGWGNNQWDNLPWGTFGFASLRMGRDRYAEYAAQRLARSSAEKLLHGHRQRDNPASDEEQVNAILDAQWGNIVADLGLPAGHDTVGQWIAGAVLTDSALKPLSKAVVDNVVERRIPRESGINAAHWVSRVHEVLADSRPGLLGGAQSTAYSVAFSWQQRFAADVERATTRALASQGLPYATGLVKRVARVLRDTVVPGGHDLSRYAPTDITNLPEETKALLATAKGTLVDPTQIADSVLAGVRNTVERQIYVSLAELISKAAEALIEEVLAPLVDGLNETQTLVRQAAAAPIRDVGLAVIRTDEYAAWPSDADEVVAARFREADNEVMLINSTEFKQQYDTDLPRSVGVNGADRRSFDEAISQAVTRVVTGSWETVGGTHAPAEDQPIVERTAAWRSRAFPKHPQTGEAIIAQRARYDIHARPRELVSRARQFIARPGESFDQFTSVSLREYVKGLGAQESELAQRHRDIAIKFNEAINRARPLASVNENALNALHGVSQMTYQYKFSEIPFRDMLLADSLKESLQEQLRVDSRAIDSLVRALTDDAKIKHIDIFGSYPNYSPLAYTSVVGPASRQWLASSPSEKKQFWSMRRARPLQASLPMHEDERRAMVAGWILGRVVGQIQLPQAPYTDPARVWDGESRRWLAFPNPLLTPPSEFLADYDWLPAVLESVLVAIAQCHQPPVMASLLPYRALRHIWDDTAQDPGKGLHRHTLTGQLNLTRWLRSGDSGTGIPSVISGGPEETIDERASRLVNYLTDYRGLAGHHYMSTGEGAEDGDPGAPGGGTFSTISVRVQASKTSIFRDVAPDVYWATQRLLDLVPACTQAAKQPDAPQQATAQPAAAPSSMDFEIPKGGNF